MKILKLNKKSQYYLFMSVFFLILMFFIFPKNYSKINIQDSSQILFKNLNSELKYAINSAIYLKEEPINNIESFFDEFSRFSDSKASNYEYVYFFKVNDSVIHIKNTFEENLVITIDDGDYSILANNYRNININEATSTLEFIYGGEIYNYEMLKKNDFKMLLIFI
jgi:hypothetical protein